MQEERKLNTLHSLSHLALSDETPVMPIKITVATLDGDASTLENGEHS